MSDLTISWFQGLQFWEEKEANLHYVEEHLDQLPQTDLVLLPEMFHTGFTMNTSLADPADDSPGIALLQRLAQKHQCAFYTSLIVQEEGCFYNRGCFVFSDGSMQHYDKRRLFAMAEEDKHFSAGNSPRIVNLKGWNINLQICYDLRFPEISRNRHDDQGKPLYDLCLYVANWPDRRRAHWNALLPARAIENQAYVVGVNRVGSDGKGFEYAGDSAVYNALGERVSASEAYEVDLHTVVLSRQALDDTRKNLNFLKDVRF